MKCFITLFIKIAIFISFAYCIHNISRQNKEENLYYNANGINKQKYLNNFFSNSDERDTNSHFKSISEKVSTQNENHLKKRWSVKYKIKTVYPHWKKRKVLQVFKNSRTKNYNHNNSMVAIVSDDNILTNLEKNTYNSSNINLKTKLRMKNIKKRSNNLYNIVLTKRKNKKYKYFKSPFGDYQQHLSAGYMAYGSTVRVDPRVLPSDYLR